MARELVLGIDIGTSSVKALFLEPNADFFRRDEEKLSIKRNGFEVEQDPNEYLSAVAKLISRNQDLIDSVTAIGLSGQTPTVVCSDENGKPTFPAMIWQDNRAEKEAQELREKFGKPMPVIGTSLPWAASACPAKLFWLARNKPEVLHNTKWIFQPKDFVGFHMTDNPVSDAWSSKGLCNVISSAPISELLDFLGWKESVVPQIKQGFESRGVISDAGARFFGIPEGVPVSVGWSDAMTGMLALGVMTKPTSFIITGTSAIVGTSSIDTPSDGGNLYVIPNSCSPLPITYGPTQTSGGAISWLSELLGISTDELISLGDSDAGESAPQFLPYIAGERAPIWRNDIRGRFIEIDTAHGKSSFARSVMEGISWAERQVVEEAERITQQSKNEVVLGGHAGNDQRWEKTRNRTLGKKTLRYEDPDTTTRGSAMLAYAMITKDLAAAFEALAIKPVVAQPKNDEIEYAKINFAKFLSAQNNLLKEKNKGAENHGK